MLFCDVGQPSSVLLRPDHSVVPKRQVPLSVSQNCRSICCYVTIFAADDTQLHSLRVSARVERPGCEIGLSPPSSATGRNKWSYTSIELT